MERLLMGFSWFFALMGVFHHRETGETSGFSRSVTQYGKATIEAG